MNGFFRLTALAVLFLEFASLTITATPPATGVINLETQLNSLDLERWSTNQFTEISSSVIDAKNWKNSSASLGRWLSEHYTVDVVRKPAWLALIGLQDWCDLFVSHPKVVNKLDPKTVTWLLMDASLTQDFFENFSPHDDLQEAFSILEEFHTKDVSRFPKYNRLALAMSFVWDQPSDEPPHHQVDSDLIPSDASTNRDRFNFWIESNEKKLTDYDLSKLEVEQLKFIIDTPVALDELRWAQRAVRYSRGNFENAYSAIRYDQRRLDQGVFSWPHKDYTLAEIRKRGGICVDQAYFASLAGKASGIPTLFFVGSGRDGGHAWFGFMKNFDRWNMDCGRYQNDRYATGTTTDPQTRETVNDHELAFLAEASRNALEFRKSTTHLRSAKVFRRIGLLPKSLEAVENAIKSSRHNLAAWELKTSILEKQSKTSNDPQLKSHLNAMMQEFMRYPDIKTACQNKMASKAREQGDDKTAAKIEDQVVRENRNKRFDLSAEVYQKRIDECCEKEDWKGGQEALHAALMKLNRETGTMFELTQFFVMKCLEAGEAEEAKRALTDFRNRSQMDTLVLAQFESLNKIVKQALKEQQQSKSKPKPKK
jgi:hypothetical protein